MASVSLPFLLILVLTAPGEAIQGRWKAVEAVREGREAKDVIGNVLTIERDSFEIRNSKGRLYQGTLSLKDSVEPHAIDFRHKSGTDAGKVWLGIYRLEGKDELTIIDNAADPAKPRPKDFVSKPDSGTVLVKFRKLASP